jgi:hypothetical protein
VLRVDHFPVRSAWSVMWLPGQRLSPLAQAFLQHLQGLAGHWEVHS